ncbi:MAG: glycosyltransferase [Anaerolineales bacterium]
MKIVLTSDGTRGDVQPNLALAVGLQKAGHHVTLATSYNYTEWIEAYGVKAHPTPFSLQELRLKPEAQAVLKSRNLFRQMELFREAFRRIAESQNAVWAAIQEAEFVIEGPSSSGALEAVSVRGIPAAFAIPVPFASTRAFPSFFLGLPRFSLGPGYNRFTHGLMHRALWSLIGTPIKNPLRKKLGLRAMSSFGEMLAESRRATVPFLYSFSAHVIPRPNDWDEHHHITGYWFIDVPPDWRPPLELMQFLESGPPPIYIGFGSMTHEDPERQTRLALRALELSGQRGVLLTGWGGLTRQAIPPNVFVVDDVPHAWLFPRMAAVVHHGGAGTTGEGLRAGVPNIITPFIGDQASWGERVFQLGVGPRAPGIRQLTAEKLAEAIRVAVNDSAMRARATALGAQIRAENGVAQAVEIIERHAGEFKRKASL